LKKQRILFRVDGNRNIGLGHVSRCLALAELLRDDFELIFAICEPDNHILNDINKVAHRLVILSHPEDVSDFNNELNPYLTGSEIVVLDGYSFITEYETTVKKHAAAVIAIDDIPSRHFVADGIINFCGSIQPTDYSKEFYTQLYLGLDYLFLRNPFLRSLPTNKSFKDRLLLNMGGADPENATHKIIQQILDIGFSGDIEVIIGQSYPFKDSLESLIHSYSFITLNQGLSTPEIFETMSHCTMAILPPSTVALEYLSTGGLLFLHQTAENQQCIKEYLIKEKLAIDYSEFTELVKVNTHIHKLTSVVEATGVFDGSSLKRVKRLFISLSLSIIMNFRKATADDVQLVYSWAIDPEVRRFSYSKSEIPWQDHVQWFEKKISDPLCKYFIIEIDNNPVGQIRFDLSEEEQDAYIISYLIDNNWRGKGLGNSVLTKGLQKLIGTCAVKKVIGYVQDFNTASIKTFNHAGFRRIVSLKYPNSSKFELSI
jgi:UDP-2,4-diacetamido-2,4,6-trideoxy-beta-L-altropyranose hydrolase